MKNETHATAAWWRQHRFFGLIIAAIIVSLILVAVALSLYNASGAAQLDLSRPDFQHVRKKIVDEKNSQSYPASGAFDESSLDRFEQMYDVRAKNVLAETVFDPAAVSDESLQVLAPAVGDSANE